MPSTLPAQSNRRDPLRAAIQSRAKFFWAIALVYAAAVILATLTLHPYFAQTWDINTFIQAGHQFLNGNPLALYAESRTAQTWPYAYPPLHALVTALSLFLGRLLPIFPEYVWARVPPILADIGVAMLLHSIVCRKSNDEQLARGAVILWLFNPITFYDTAVQGHFESEWLFFVLLAYLWLEEGRSIILSSIALAVAVLFKQVAIVFAIPFWLFVLTNKASNLHPSASKQLALSILAFASIIAVACLPFLLYSNDFLYMNLTYVENVPVQTQSWIVALLGLTRDAPTAMTSDFFLLRWQTLATIAVAVLISFWAMRHNWNLYLTATLIGVAFFLTSKKVMGYYYVMLFPFLLASLLPRKRFDLVLIALVATTSISLSPYYAAWTNHAHWWIYAGLGIVNSAFFVWLGKKMTDDQRRRTEEKPSVLGPPSFVGFALFAAAVIAALLQPLIAGTTSPIRAPIIASGMEANAAIVFALLIVAITATLWLVRRVAFSDERVSHWSWLIVLLFAPLFFSVYTLTKESTAIFEIVLHALGV